MKVLFFILLLLTCGYGVSAQESVYIKANEEGVGILRSRAGECFVITPAHVVEDAMIPIQIVGARNVRSIGNPDVQKYNESDLAVVRVQEGGRQNCKDWKTSEAYDDIVENSFEGFLETRHGNGAVQVMKVLLAEKHESSITVRPLLSGDHIRKGMSGSSLFVQADGKKVFLGMLLDISREGVGNILKANRMDAILSDFFTGKEPGGATDTKASAVSIPAERVIEENGFKFEFVESRRSGSNVTCKLYVTSLQKDAKIVVTANYYQKSARIYDQNNIEFWPESVRLGNQTDKGSVGRDYTLIHERRTELEFKFKDFLAASTGITLFRFVVKFDNGNETEIKFRNIPLSGSAGLMLNPFMKGIQSREAGGFDFQLLECKRNGGNVICRLLVKSMGNDGDLRIVANYYQNSARIYDQQGLEYYPETVLLGNQIDKGQAGNNYILVQDIQVPLEFTFKNVPTSAQGISLFRFVMQIPRGETSELKFRNIPFTGQNVNFLSAPIAGIQSRQAQGFDFQLLECKRNGDNVICRLLVKSTGRDGDLRIVANYYQNSAKIYDEQNREFLPKSARLGTQTENGTLGKNYILVEDVQTSLEFTFGDFPRAGSVIPLLRFIVYRPDQSHSEVRFTKIPIT